MAKTEVEEKIEVSQGKPSTFLDTYRKQLKEASETYSWFKPHLNASQRNEWERTIEGLGVVVKALEAGFCPMFPPKNWSSGVLTQYVAPIPEQVRKSIDLAIPIFGMNRILIYDPNEEHFQRPRKYDPIASGFVDVANQRLHFLVGQWDLEKDLKFIEGSGATHQTERVSQDIGSLIDYARNLPQKTRTIQYDEKDEPVPHQHVPNTIKFPTYTKGHWAVSSANSPKTKAWFSSMVPMHPTQAKYINK